MKIQLHEIPVREVVAGYLNNDEEGVVGYGGRLNIRPKYQREFIYKDAQRNAVIETVMKGFPLNVMYWVRSGESEYEVMDGQQRTISICEYVEGNFSLDDRYFHNLTDFDQEKILDYKLMVYFCEGNDQEKLDWFETINIAGEKLTPQELKNAIYTGPWLSDAKRYFSKTGCGAYKIAEKYMKGTPIRQEYLETVLDWKSEGKIKDYMATHQKEPNATELWLYFQAIISWVEAIFPKYRKEMKGLDWGRLYNCYKSEKLDAGTMEIEIAKLMEDDDVTRKSGIYEYLLSGEEKHLSIRSFTPSQKRGAYERQKGICPKCSEHFEIEGMEADHITPWHEGGKTLPENCQMLCKHCNRVKSGK